MHARHAHVQRVAVWECAARHQGGDDGDTGQLSELKKFFIRMGFDDAPTDVKHRLLRLDDHARGFAYLLGVRARHRTVAGQINHRRPVKRRHRLKSIFGDVDEHWAGTSGTGDVERLSDCARNFCRIGHEEVVLGNGHRDAANISLLERVGADRLARHLTGDRDHRHRIHIGVGNGRH